jgi:hypothetical protein
MRQLEKIHRKSFLKWCAGIIASSFAINKLSAGNKVEIKDEAKIKMLTEDGRLVEIDKKHLTGNSKQKISETAIHNWIKPL